MKKVGVVSQKGGVGKSTIARDLARQFAFEGWKVKIADLDLKQTTSCDWNAIRQAANIEPGISVESFQSPQKALLVSGFDLLVFDGKPHSDIETRRIAEASDLVVIPTAATRDDLVPQVLLAHELQAAGIQRERIIFVLNNVIDWEGPEIDAARQYINQAGFAVLDQAVPRRKAYQNAQNEGRSISETPFPGLKALATTAVEQLAAILLKDKVPA